MREPVVTTGTVVAIAVAIGAAVIAWRARPAPEPAHAPLVEVETAVAPPPEPLMEIDNQDAATLRREIRRKMMAHSLSRCCGTERATLGPLFGTAVVGNVGDFTDPVMIGWLPAFLQPETTQLTIDLWPAMGQFGIHTDGLEIRASDHELCEALETRLENQWGPQARWVNPARHQAAAFAWIRPDSDTSPCALRFVRMASTDPAHCLRDERVATTQEIDVKRRCVKPPRATGCMLDRDRGAHFFEWCCVDAKHQRFWTDDSGCEHTCTVDEQVEFASFGAC